MSRSLLLIPGVLALAFLLNLPGLAQARFGAPRLVQDISPGASFGCSAPDQVHPMVTDGTDVYFYAATGDMRYASPKGMNFWKSDGSSTGTIPLVTHSWADSQPIGTVVATGNKRVFFTGKEDSANAHLWLTDGTPAGTRQVLNLYAGSSYYEIFQMERFDDQVIFCLKTDTQDLLGISDDSTSGTRVIKDFAKDPEYGDLVLHWHFLQMVGVNRGTAFFTSYSNERGLELWKSDGSTSGTIRLGPIKNAKSISSPYTVFIDESMFFMTSSTMDPNDINAVWASNVTSTGTVRLSTTAASRYSTGAVAFNGRYYYVSAGASGSAGPGAPPYHYRAILFESDGTTMGTKMVVDVQADSTFWEDGQPFLIAGKDMMVFGGIFGCWRSDGTQAGTVKAGLPFSVSVPIFSPFPITQVPGRELWCVNGYDDAHGTELWLTDWTASGSALLSDIYPGSRSSSPWMLTSCVSKIFFFATEPQCGTELWSMPLPGPVTAARGWSLYR